MAYTTNTKGGVRVINKTRSFEVININRDGMQVRLVLRNASEKTITAFRIVTPTSLGESGMKEDRIEESQMIAPGSSYELSIALSDIKSDPSKADDQDIIILAVLFEDRTSDGDTETAAEMEAERLGEKIQMGRILSLIQNTLKLPDDDLPSAMKGLRMQAAALSLDVEASRGLEMLSPHYGTILARSKEKLADRIARGLYFVREGFLVRMREVEREISNQSSGNLREQLTRFQKEYERIFATL